MSLRLAPALLLTTALLACGSYDPAGPPGETPSISLTVGSSTVGIEQGASFSLPLTVARAGGFAGGVSFSVTGLPDGVTAAATPLAGSATSSSLALMATGAAMTGSYPLVVRATGNGVVDATQPVTLTISANRSYAIEPAATQLTIRQGESGSTQISIVRSNFTGAVALAVLGAPAEIIGLCSPQSVTGNSATLTFQVAGDTPLANYDFDLVGTAAGMTNRTVRFRVTVLAR